MVLDPERARLMAGIACPTPRRPGSPGTVPGPLPGGAALPQELIDRMMHAFAAASIEANRGYLLTDANPVQIASANPLRVGLEIDVPFGSTVVYRAGSRLVSPAAGSQNAGARISPGNSFIYDWTYVGPVYIMCPGPWPPAGLDIRVTEWSASD